MASICSAFVALELPGENVMSCPLFHIEWYNMHIYVFRKLCALVRTVLHQSC